MSERTNTHNPLFIAIKKDKGYSGEYIDLNCLEPCDLSFGEYVIYGRDDLHNKSLEKLRQEAKDLAASHDRLVKALEAQMEQTEDWPMECVPLALATKESKAALAEAKALTAKEEV